MQAIFKKKNKERISISSIHFTMKLTFLESNLHTYLSAK